MKKITTKELWDKVHKGEPVYLNDVCESDAAYMVLGAYTMKKYPGETPFQLPTNSKSVTNAILCGQEITKEEFDSF